MMGGVSELVADRLGGPAFGSKGAEYKFERIKRARAEAARERPDLPVLDFGIGESDDAADPLVVRALSAKTS